MAEFKDIIKLDIQVNSNKSQLQLTELETKAASIRKEF
jgi:hypothetical protein